MDMKLDEGDAPDPEEGDYVSMANSRDPTSVLRCGPCASYEQLVPFETIVAHATKFRSCTSQEELKKTAEETVALRKLFSVLTSACKAALKELETAIQKHEANAEKMEKEKKDKAKKAGSAAKKKRAEATKNALAVQAQAGVGCPIFEMDKRQEVLEIKSVSEIKAKSFLEPFLWTLPKGSAGSSGGDAMKLDEEVRTEVEKFSVQFAESTLKASISSAQHCDSSATLS